LLWKWETFILLQKQQRRMVEMANDSEREGKVKTNFRKPCSVFSLEKLFVVLFDFGLEKAVFVEKHLLWSCEFERWSDSLREEFEVERMKDSSFGLKDERLKFWVEGWNLGF
jgi:hypothetical protein